MIFLYTVYLYTVQEAIMARGDQVNSINRRLIIVSAVLLLVCSAGFIVPFIMKGRMLIPVICLVFGVLGGFMSLEQRLGRLPAEAHDLLSGSWFQVVLRPLYGGIFALVAYILLLSGLVTSAIFPVFVYPSFPETGITPLYFMLFLTDTVPASGPDFAKLLFWSFAAGFSERLIPQIGQGGV